MDEAVKKRELRIVPPLPAGQQQQGDLAVMLTGGGARAAYQVGLLKGLARNFPALKFQIITGVSAGAINAIFLASRDGGLAAKAHELERLWRDLQCHHVFRTNYSAFVPYLRKRPHGLFNAGPLAAMLRGLYDTHRRGEPIAGIQRNLDSGEIHSAALIALDYSTGQNVRWVQGPAAKATFQGALRRAEQAQITVEHVLASAALPFVFPAVRIGSRWYGDGGIRLSSPLSAAVHLGASRILAMSTGYQRTVDEASTPVVSGYPPAVQIIGQLFNAIFLDAINEDVDRMRRMNEVIRLVPEEARGNIRPIDLFVLRPSRDIGKLAGAYQQFLPPSMKMFTRSLGAHHTDSPDFISMLMFEPNYLRVLIEMGDADIDLRLPELRAFLDPDAESSASKAP